MLNMPASADADKTVPQIMSPLTPLVASDCHKQNIHDKEQVVKKQKCTPAAPPSITLTPEGGFHPSFPLNITITDKLLHFPHKTSDRGVRTISKIAQRQIWRAAECAGTMQAILYDIFLLPNASNLIPNLLTQGKLQATKITLHKHSLGVSPIFAFGSLLLLAATHIQWNLATCFTGNLDLNSKNILQRLCQVARDYDRATQSLALAFKFGLRFHALTSAALAEIKQIGTIPWPLIVDEPEEPKLLQCRIINRRHQRQRQ